MTIIPILLKFGPWLLAAAGVLFGMFRHQQARAVTAQAGQKAAEAQATAAQVANAEAQANADAAQAGGNAAAARIDIDIDVATKTPEEVRDDLRGWTKP